MRTVLILLLGVLVAIACPARSAPLTHDTTAPVRVYGTAPPITLMLYVLGGDSLLAINAPLENPSNNADSCFLSERFRRLPIVGGWHGNHQPNLEEILRLHPDLIVSWDTPLLQSRVDGDLAKIGLKAVAVNIDETTDYPAAFRQLGVLVGRAERGERLAAYAEKEIRQLRDFLSTIPESRRMRVYYAEGRDGLQTECDQSFHAEPISFAGGRNIQRCRQSSVMGLQTINFEQLLNEDPEVIVVQDDRFYRQLFEDPLWRKLNAVANRRVIPVPKTPFNWLDRPPSFMRILGVHWLAAHFYPENYPYDLRRKTSDFFALFFGVTLSDRELDQYFPQL